MRRLVSLAAVALVFTGCSLFSANDPEDDLKERRQAWLALGITDYSFDFVRSSTIRN